MKYVKCTYRPSVSDKHLQLTFYDSEYKAWATKGQDSIEKAL
jgi:hypothetical protein